MLKVGEAELDAAAGMRSCSRASACPRVSPRTEGQEAGHALILRSVDPNGRVKSSASRRFAGQMELLVQRLAQRVIELVVEVLDVNALLARID